MLAAITLKLWSVTESKFRKINPKLMVDSHSARVTAFKMNV